MSGQREDDASVDTELTDPNVYPPGWNAQRVKGVIEYYDSQTEAEELEELETCWAEEDKPRPLIYPQPRLEYKRFTRSKREQHG